MARGTNQIPAPLANRGANQISVSEEEMEVNRGFPVSTSVRHVLGDVALNLLSFVKVTGGKSGKRSMEVRGPISADVVVHVKPVG